MSLPKAPLRLTGAISDKYIGTSAVFIPQLRPIKNRPKIKHSMLRNN